MSDKKQAISDKTSDKRLLHCPFCGGEAELSHRGYCHDMISVYGRCKKCDAHGESFMYCFWSPEQDEAENEAIEAWNTRKPVDAVLDRLEELKNTPPELQYRDLTLQTAIEIIKEGLA